MIKENINTNLKQVKRKRSQSDLITKTTIIKADESRKAKSTFKISIMQKYKIYKFK